MNRLTQVIIYSNVSLCQLILPDLSWKKIDFVVKIFAGRPRDIEDARTVLLKNPDIDVQYIRKWLKEVVHKMQDKRILGTVGRTLLITKRS